MKKERIAIIDHNYHRLYVQDIDMDVINEKYGGNEEDYIKDAYDLSDNWSWDYIVCAEYFPLDSDFIEINFEEL